MLSSHNFRSTSPAREALLSVSTAPPGSPPRLAPSAGLVVVQASRWAMADPEDEDDGQQATPQANKERRRGRYRRGEQAGSRPPARTASTRIEGTVRDRGDRDQFSSSAGGCGSRRSLREHPVAGEAVVTLQAPLGGRRFADRQCCR